MSDFMVRKGLQNLKLDLNFAYLHIQFDSQVETISSAILNGGHAVADHIINIRVPKSDDENTEFLPPEVTLQNYADKHNWEGKCVGMMTAARMDSFTNHFVQHEDVIVECFVTVGISNARRAGDSADCRYFDNPSLKPGTINIVLGTNAKLSRAAMVEAVMIVSEAKATAMQELGVISPVSNKIATGTGTDSIVIFNGNGREIKYCGKHVLFGEMIAEVIFKAIKESVERIRKG